ncbi:penicillin acylase family protein [bacterium]|nr:penicillin acylase family protein [bacterium]
MTRRGQDTVSLARRARLALVAGSIALGLLTQAACAARWVGRGFPAPGDSRQDAAGAAERVRIEFDYLYVPHVYASSDEDAMFGLGWAMASARLFQMDMFRHLARGEMSLLTGDSATVMKVGTEVEIDVAEVDHFLKILDFADSGRRLYERSSAPSRALIDAFAMGVNAFVEGNRRRLPAPYSIPAMIGGKEFRPWTVDDSMAVAELSSWFLSKNYEDEIFAVLALRDGMEVPFLVDLLSPYYPLNPRPFETQAAMRERLAGVEFTPGLQGLRDLMDGTKLTGPAGGSNNWVVSGKKTESGLPLLSNDPHLSLATPGPWYVAHLRSPAMNVAGAMIPGTPIMMVGHNEKTAWGVTMARVDNSDLAVEIVDGARKTYEYDGKTYPLVRRPVTAGGETRTIFATRFGPIVSRLTPDSKSAVSLRWTGWFASDVIDSGFALMRAGSVRDALDAGRGFGHFNFNLLAADTAGNIGWTITGDAPRRVGFAGLLPHDASTPDQRWEGFADPRDMGEIVNPEEGFIATANNRPEIPTADAIGSNYVAPYRFEQIKWRLEQKEKLNVNDMRAIQADQYSRQASLILPWVQNIQSDDADVRRAIQELRNWDRRVTGDSRGAMYYEVFLTHFQLGFAETFRPDTRHAFFAMIPSRQMPVDAFYRKETALWADNDARDERIRRALRATVRELRDRFGENLATATWGDLHRLNFHHPLSDAPLIGASYALPSAPYGGDANTVNMGAFHLGETYDVEVIASLRFLVDMAHPERARFSYPLGQSEVPAHPAWTNLLSAWFHVEDHPLLFAEEDIADAQRPSVVFLSPPGAKAENSK